MERPRQITTENPLFIEEYNGIQSTGGLVHPLLGQAFVHKLPRHWVGDADRAAAFSRRLCGGRCKNFWHGALKKGIRKIFLAWKFWWRLFSAFDRKLSMHEKWSYRRKWPKETVEKNARSGPGETLFSSLQGRNSKRSFTRHQWLKLKLWIQFSCTNVVSLKGAKWHF